ncbi:MAG: acyl-CoA thioesterase-1 [Kiritimatiellia bacterium]|jgi:acyl-CoA thioesterase-1
MIHPRILIWGLLCAGLFIVTGAEAGNTSRVVNVANYTAPIRMVCIGDSITHGGHLSYVSRLSRVMGESWQVTNLGVSGAALLQSSDKPYNRLGEYGRALQIKPDVVTIALGTNDSKGGNWQHKANFEANYKQMISELKNANPKVMIYCCLPPPARGNKWSINGDVIRDEVIPMIRKIAEDTDCGVIDFYEALGRSADYAGDGVHVNNEAHKLMTIAIFTALTGRDKQY